MKFNFIVNKSANFYYFLHNLCECEWPWPYRSQINKAWKKELGKLTEQEKKALKEFKAIYQKYFLKKYIGKSFFLSKNPWKALSGEISKQDLNKLKEVFSVWQKKFENIYKKDLPNLRQWQKELRSQFKKSNRKLQAEKINQILSVFYNRPKLKSEIRVYLMLAKKPSSEKYASGAAGEHGRGLDGKSVLLELSRCPTEKVDYVMGILWHEMVHCFFSPHYVVPLLLKMVKSKKKMYYLEEVINRSLLPIGILSMKFFKAPTPLTLTRGSLSDINSKQTQKILKLSDQYIQQEKKIDKNYIKKLVEILNLK